MYRYGFGYRVLSAFTGTIGSMMTAVILSAFTLTLCMRWFLFTKAGEKGWKALIPFYSDYALYKLVWSGRIYLALMIGFGAAFVTGFTFGLISAGFGGFLAFVIAIVVASAYALASLILQFKTARAFGQNNFFALGLYLLNPAFVAILAFGDCEYKGVPENDGIGVPKVLENIGKKKEAPVNYQPYGQQSDFQGYPQQQPYNAANYPPAQQYPQQPVQQQPNNQPPFNG
ncbi:MAG: hypothetical protein E7318_09130 [Clostridiales bacterium]|nr:hypothetical protein [Clostridiales bacterium]